MLHAIVERPGDDPAMVVFGLKEVSPEVSSICFKHGFRGREWGQDGGTMCHWIPHFTCSSASSARAGFHKRTLQVCLAWLKVNLWLFYLTRYGHIIMDLDRVQYG